MPNWVPRPPPTTTRRNHALNNTQPHPASAPSGRITSTTKIKGDRAQACQVLRAARETRRVAQAPRRAVRSPQRRLPELGAECVCGCVRGVRVTLSGRAHCSPGSRPRGGHAPVIIRARCQIPQSGRGSPFVIPAEPIPKACPQHPQGGVLLQLDFTVFHAASEPLDEHVVPPLPLAIHADGNAQFRQTSRSIPPR